MNANFKVLFKCMGFALLAWLAVNTVAFLFEMIQNGVAENWVFQFKHGIFFIDGKPIGLAWGLAKTNGFLGIVFLIALIQNFRSGNFKFRTSNA